MLCPKCNTQIDPQDRYCRSCGVSIARALKAERRKNRSITPQSDEQKKKTRLAMIFQILSLVLILFSFCMLFLPSDAFFIEETYYYMNDDPSAERHTFESQKAEYDINFFEYKEDLVGKDITEKTVKENLVIIYFPFAFLTAAATLVITVLKRRSVLTDSQGETASAIPAWFAAAFCLVIADLFLFIIADMGTPYLINGPEFIPSAFSFPLYRETLMQYDVTLIPSILGLCAAAILLLISGFRGIVKVFKKKA